MEEQEMKNNGGYQEITPRSTSQYLSSLSGGIDWWIL
jgi:hypothetical protein